MNAELLVHGPRHALYGLKAESAYCQNFDVSQQKDSVRFVVDLRQGYDGRHYCYYTYCRYKNVYDIDGRSGAYIGLTIRLDVCFVKFDLLFSVMDLIFSSGVVGTIVKSSQNGFDYIVSDFDCVKSVILEKVEKPLGSILSSIILPGTCETINNTYFMSGSVVCKGLEDMAKVYERLADLKKIGKLIFGSEYPSEQSQLILAKCEKECNVLKGKCNSLSLESADLHSKINEKQSQINSLQSVNKSLDSELKTIRHRIEDKECEIGGLNIQTRNLETENKKLRSDNDALRKQIQKNQICPPKESLGIDSHHTIMYKYFMEKPVMLIIMFIYGVAVLSMVVYLFVEFSLKHS